MTSLYVIIEACDDKDKKDFVVILIDAHVMTSSFVIALTDVWFASGPGSPPPSFSEEVFPRIQWSFSKKRSYISKKKWGKSVFA